LLSLVH